MIAAATGPSTRKAGEHDGQAVQAEREDEDVLADDPHRLPRQADGLGERLQRVAHQDDRAGLGGDVGADAAERDPDVGQGQGGGVVDPVADHRDDAPFVLAAVDPLGLVRRRQLGLDLLDVHLLGHRPGRRGAVAGQDRQVA